MLLDRVISNCLDYSDKRVYFLVPKMYTATKPLSKRKYNYPFDLSLICSLIPLGKILKFIIALIE